MEKNLYIDATHPNETRLYLNLMEKSKITNTKV